MPVKFWTIFQVCTFLMLVVAAGPLIGPVLFAGVVYVFYFSNITAIKIITGVILLMTVGIPAGVVAGIIYAIFYIVYAMISKDSLPSDNKGKDGIIEGQYTVIYPSR